ncbi:TetR/AcrR family transcriptional regulator [Propionibacteriaceae bacterium Y1700]|uniref:TetR/AcrR family transcriptional regulator n=1 Tax=Microlunatus sp. Y1700 TaxID=3418487 RepID=UPI003DA747DB
MMKRLKVDERRERLVAAAIRVVARVGVSSATTRAIVTEAGMSLSTFHYAFTSRDELLGECVNTLSRAREAAFADLALDVEDPEGFAVAALRRYVNYVADNVTSQDALWDLIPYARHTPHLHHLAVQEYEASRALLMMLINVLIDAGTVRPVIGVDELCDICLVITDGLTVTHLQYRDREASLRSADLAAQMLASLFEHTP